MANNASLEERKAALTAYIAAADDQDAARKFMLECLDSEADAELLDWLVETQFEEPSN